MSTGAIFTVLSNIPWGQVVENAPKVASGAAKLWNSVTGFRQGSAPGDLAGSGSPPPLTETEVLRSRVQALEEAIENLGDQMQASSELIKALADQNAQLVQRIELNRVRAFRLGVAVAVLTALFIAAVTFLAMRSSA